MHTLMSNLLANAAGKEPARPLGRNMHFHADSFILPGEYHRDHVDSETRRDDDDSESVQLYSPSADKLPSYVPCYDVNGYSSSPTYFRGDFYHLTPPTSPDMEQNNYETRTESRKVSHKFSIDFILGSDTSDTTCEDSPARVYSALTSDATSCSSGQFRFSMTDWSVFQSSARPTSCNKEASQVSSLKALFWCHVCDQFCSSKEDARQHQMEHSNKGIKCNLQRQFFSIHGYVTEHTETNYLNRVKCGLCDKILTNCFFGKHMRCHTAHVCEICGHESTSNGQLLKHMNGHLGLRLYKCRVCERAFGDKAQMIRHEQMHVGDKKQCRFCRKSFSSKYSRVVHERIHTGQNPYTCAYPGCNRSFPQKIQLTLHMEHHC